MQTNNNLSCIPFYSSLEEQDYRKWYAYDTHSPVKVSSDYLIPFFINVGDSALSISDIYLYYADGSFVRSVRNDLMNNYLIQEQKDGKYVIKYYASHNNAMALDEGAYYLAIVLTGGTVAYYSEVFCAVSEIRLANSYIKIDWWNEQVLECGNDIIPYGSASVLYGNFKNTLFLDTEIGKPEYEFTEEGEERNGVFFPIKQISEKTYRMRFIAPEYITDVIRLIRMADHIEIRDKQGRGYEVERFESDVEWLENGYLADVQCSFQTDTIVKKVGKAYL